MILLENQYLESLKKNEALYDFGVKFIA